MARVLLEKETIHTAEVDMLIAGESAQTVINFIDKKYNPEKPAQTIAPATPVAPAVEEPKVEEPKADEPKAEEKQDNE